jgi:hypothetical protein
MKKRYALFAAAFLLVGSAAGRCQGPAPAAMLPPASSAEDRDESQPTFGARLRMLGQRVGDWSRLRLVSQQVATPAEPAAAAKEIPVVPPPPPPAAPPLYAVGAPCLCAQRHRTCGEAIDDWLTYRRLDQDCCFCIPKCAPCCNPPLYTYFVGNCCVQPIPPGHGPLCACAGCSSNGHRPAGFLEGMQNNRFWPGNGHFRQWCDDFLFKHDESVAEGPQ